MINQSVYQVAQISHGNYIKSNTEIQLTYSKKEKNDKKKKYCSSKSPYQLEFRMNRLKQQNGSQFRLRWSRG